MNRPGACLGAAEAAATLVAAEPVGTGHAVDLGGRVAQRRADLVDVALDAGALAALAGVVLADLEPTGDDHAGALGQRLGDVLGVLAPDAAADEDGVAVLPLVGGLVQHPVGGRHGEVGDGLPGGREPKLRITREVAHDGDRDVPRSHGAPYLISGRMTLVRSTDSFSPS